MSHSYMYIHRHSVDDRITLKRLKYVIQPVWWKQEENDSSFDVDESQIEDTYDDNKQIYKDMSWNEMKVSYEILPQQKIGVSKTKPDMNDVKEKTRQIVQDSGYVEGVDYDGISVTYWKANDGNLANGGGWGSVNGLFTWITYPTRSKSQMI